MFPTPTSLIARIDAVIRDITIYELDPEKKGEHLAHLDQLRREVASDLNDGSGKHWYKFKRVLSVIFRYSPNLIKRLETYEKESAELKKRHAMQSSSNMISPTAVQLGGHQMPYDSSAVALTPQPKPQLHVGGRIISPSQMYAWETEGWPQGTMASQVPVVPGPTTGQYSQYGLPGLHSLPPPRGGNILVTQPEARQDPTHYRRPSDMSMAGHGGDEYQLRWPQTSFEATRPSGESSRSSNYQSDWNNSDGSQSTYHSRRS